MQLVVQSSLLKALSFALLTSIWQMALLWFALIFILKIFKLSASQKFNIAFVAQLSGFILFVYSLLYFYTNKTSFTVFEKSSIQINQLQVYFIRSTPYIAIVYVILLMWQFIKITISYSAMQHLRKQKLKKMPAYNRIFVQQITALLSLKRKVNIYLSSSLSCPLTFGFFKPVILVPLAAVNHLTKEQMEAVILHELAHIKRCDYLLNFIESFIEKIFFFNIFSKMIHNIIEHERENACDDFVLQFRYNSFHYAEALLKLGRLQTINAFAMAASGKKENVLLLRIKRLIHGDNNKTLYFNFSGLAHCFLALIVALPLMFVSFESTFSNQNPEVTKRTNALRIIKKQQRVIASLTNNSELKPSVKISPEKSPGKHLLTKELQNSFAEEPVKAVPDYFVNASQPLDSLKQLTYDDALNKQFVIDNNIYKKAMSYQNFKQLEEMLYASGDSINITEDSESKNNYKKLVTIEATDANGNKNIYKVIIELYQ